MLQRAYKIFFGLCFLLLPVAAHAATMEVSPEFTQVQEGKNLTLTIVTQSTEAINAVTATLSFQPDILSITSLSKNDSAFTLWVQEPKFSNTSGTLSFSGIVPDPGVSDRALVLVVQMHAKRAGTAVLRFNSAAVLANDGQGTNILTGTVPATITVTPAPAPEPAAPAQEAPATAPTQEAPAAVSESSFEPPIITQYQNAAKEYAPITIGGTSKYPGASVNVYFVSGDTKIKGTASVDPSGHFKYVQADGLQEGEYTAYATVQDWNGSSGNSNTVYIEVLSADRVTILGLSIPVWFLILIIVTLFVLLVLLGTYSYIRIRRLNHHIAYHYHKR